MPTTSKPPSALNAWPAVVSIALGTFVMVTSEFLPIGLLSSIARDLNVTEGRAGLMVTIPGVLAAVTAPIITLAARQADRRHLLLILTGLLVAANMIVALAPNFTVLLLGRVLLGISVGGFWTFGVSIGRRLVVEANGGRATTIILAGISLGTVAGVPIGTAFANSTGWRASFSSIAALGLAILAGQALLLPTLLTQHSIGLEAFATILKSRDVIVVFIAGALIALGHFAGYTYIEPYLLQVLRLTPGEISWTLAAYGTAGVLGTFIGERLSAVDARRGLMHVALAMALLIVIASGAGASPSWAIASIIGWGLAFGAVPVCIQLWIFAVAPVQFEAASALMVTVFQVSLASGALVGGTLVDVSGPRFAFVSGAICCGLCALHIRVFGSRPSTTTHAEFNIRPGDPRRHT